MASIRIEIDDELKQRLNKVIRWGLQKSVYTILTEQLVEALEGPYGYEVLAALLQKDIDIMEKYKKGSDKDVR